MKPSYIMRLRKADMIVRVGMELDQWMDALTEQSGNRAIQKGQPANLDASANVERLEVPTVMDRSQGDVHPFGNPHYWLDPVNGKRIAHAVCDTLCAIDPGSAKDYQARRDAFEKRIDEKLVGWQKRMEPFKGTAIVTFHRSWSYLVNRFALTVPIELEPKPGIPPSAAHLDEVVATVRARGVKCILQEPFHPEKPGQFVSEKTGIPLLVLHTEPDPKADLPDYLAMLDADVEALAKACEKKGTSP